MSQTKFLVSTILQTVSDLRGESTVNTSARRIRAVSRAENDYSNRKFWHTHLLKDQSMAGDTTSDYTVGSATYPMRENGLADIRIGGTTEAYRYDIVDKDTYNVKISNDSGTKVAYLWFDDTNNLWKVHVNATPAATKTIYYSFYWQSPTRTATTDYVTVLNPMIIVKLALADIYEGEDEVTKSLTAKNEAEQLISEAIGADNSPAVNQTVVMGNNVSQGYGTY